MRTYPVLSRGIALTAVVALAGAVVAPNAVADANPPAGTPGTVTADALPTAQVDGVVWSTAVAGDTVVAVGRFTTARPAGVAAGGAGQFARSNIMAFNITTGVLSTTFAPSLNGQALSVEASRDGSKVYVGGDFTTVNGVSQARLAALNVVDGSLDTSFRPTVSSRVNALSVTASTVYAGGNFFSANGLTRTRLAAFNRTNAALLPWAPAASDGEVHAIVASGNRVVVGGKFATISGTARQGIAAVDATTGALVPWSSQPIPTWNGGQSWVSDLTVSDGVVYGTANGEGWHWFDGRFAAQLATGDLVWLDNCYGASYGIATQGNAVYSASHSHDCTSIGGFLEMIPRAQRALAITKAATGTDQTESGANSNHAHQPVPTLLHWFPTLAAGTATGQVQAAWTVSATDTYVVLGGEFPSENGTAQAGLVRFALPSTAPKNQGPQYTADLIPAGISPQAGRIRVAWSAIADRDNTELTYEVLRDDNTAPIFTTKEKSNFWTLPSMGFVDEGLTPGSSHPIASG